MQGRTKLYASILAEITASRATTSRFVDLAVSLRVADVDQAGDGRTWRTSSDEELLAIGGRWDRQLRRAIGGRGGWIGEASTQVVLRVHRGQEDALRWFADWLRRKITGAWTGTLRPWSALLVGGRRSGKSHGAVLMLVLHAIAVPGSIAWAVSPTLEANAEIDRAIQSLVPRSWYVRREVTTGRPIEYKLVNGSKISLRSGAKAGRSLKAGRVDMALMNEAQLMDERAFVNLRGGIADRGGIVLMTANPPDQPVGRWVEDYYVGVRDGLVAGAAFELDPRRNPFVEVASLQALQGETDERTYQREVLGLFTPIGDVVMHAWSPDNLREPGSELVDITARVTRRELGKSFGYVLGVDLQKTPACVAAVLKVFESPDLPGEELAFVVDEFQGEDEEALLAEIETSPRWRSDGRIEADNYRGWVAAGDDPKDAVHVAAVLDASSWWEDSAHNPGRSSDRRFAARNWRALYKPNKASDANPAIVERMKIGNARLCNAAGVRRLFVSPRCKRIATAMRLYPNLHGKPDRRSEHAHWIDTVTYVTFRFWGAVKPAKGRRLEYRSVGQRFDRGTEATGPGLVDWKGGGRR